MIVEVLDGHDTIGGNKISVCSSGGECFLLDFGLNFSSWGRFFEEFVNPRTGRVLEDLLKLELIPEIPVYRRDIAPERLSYDGRYRFVFFSHAHADHMGLSGLLSGDIPMVLTKETLAISLVDAEIQGSKIWSRLKDGRRKSGNCGGLIREDVRCASKGGGERDLVRRKVALDDINLDFLDAVDLEDVWENMEIFPVYHSVVGSSALGVLVDGWWVVYTGDLKLRPVDDERDWKILYGERRNSLSFRTWEFLKKAKNLHPMVLITEGTTVTRERVEGSTEMDVFENALEVVEKSEGLILVDFPRRHTERLLTFLKVASETSRKLVLMPKDYAYLVKIGEIEPAWKLGDEEKKDILVYHPANASFKGEERRALEMAMKEDILIDHRDVRSEPKRYILSSGYWYITTLLDFDEDILRNSVYIHSTSEAYTEEQEIDAVRLGNWLSRFGIKPYGFRIKNGEIEFTGRFHASGHATPRDLELIIDTLDPEIIIPVHTLDKGWFVKRWKEKVRVEKRVVVG